MHVTSDNKSTEVFDKHFALKCPNCGVQSNLSAISIPRYEYLVRFRPKKVGVAYTCANCNLPVFLRFQISDYDIGNNRIKIHETYEEVEHSKESFEYQYLPSQVGDDFKEALTCYSALCYQAFAAMCRRCIQSAFMELGAQGKDKVSVQLKDLKDAANIDTETYNMLEQIVISGHDGAHPHLPKLSPDRARILLELMKDVLYQLFVRQAKIKEAFDLRKQDIDANKD